MEAGSSPANPVVVMTLSPTGLSIARSLAPHGVTVYGIDSARREIGHYSQWVRHDSRISYLRTGEQLVKGLLSFGREQALRPVLFVAGDPYIEFVAANRAALGECFLIPDSLRPEVAPVIVDKRMFYRRCQELDVAMPATFFPGDEAEAVKIARHIGYPAVVKPTLSYVYRRKLGGNKLAEVHNPEDLLRWWRRIRSWGGESVLQEVIRGPEANIFVAALYTDRDLRCRSIFTARKSRQYPPRYGSASYVEAAWSDEIAALSIDLVRKLGYHGICGTEFKLDTRDGKWKLIELNPRPTLWFGLSRAAGVDVVWDAYCDLLGAPNPMHVNCQDDTVRWQLLARDLISGLHSVRGGELRLQGLLSSVISPFKKEFAVLSWQDPRAVLAYPLYNLSKYVAMRYGNGSRSGT